MRRPLVRDDGRLFIVAADHPARGALGVRTNPLAMANRYDLLQRLALALSRPGVDGVLGTPDVIEDLALLGALDGKIAVGSMNRGGLRGAAFEMDDRFTGYDVDSMMSSGLDAGKLLVRVNLQDHATAGILENTANAVTESARAGLPIMLEPFMSEWVDGRIVNDRQFERLSGMLGSGRAVTGGEHDASTRYIAPTVLVDVPRDSAVMGEEIFGPVLPIVTVEDLDDAIRFIRAGDKPLALYVFTERSAVKRRILTETSSGAVGFGVPAAHLAVAGLPFGGVGESGSGAYHGERSLRTFSHEKAVLSKALKPDTMQLIYPPYTAAKDRFARGLLRRLG